MARTLAMILLAAALTASACSDTSDETGASSADEVADVATGTLGQGIRLVSPEQGDAITAEPPDDLIVLDVRTPEEFAEGHLEGAIMIDFYAADFADQLAQLDSDVPYLLYCRSGNRSSQTAALMSDLGFADVAEVDGGVLAWTEAGLPLTQS